MPNLKEVRNRIVSVSSTQQITSAMKVVSAAKLRRAQDAIIRMRPYANKLREVFQNLSASLSSSDGVYSKERAVKKVLLVVITSNRGLAGAFNANVIKKASSLIKNEYKGASVDILAVGKKGADFFRKGTNGSFEGDNSGKYNSLFDNLNFDAVALLAQSVMNHFAKGDYDKVELIYNQFKNAAVQLSTIEQFLPVVAAKQKDGVKKTTSDYIFEPDQEEIVQDLIPLSLKTQFYKALLDSHAAEHGARMTAMHKATDNAKEMLKALKLSYNKARQAAITNEILEIVGGAEALNN